MATEDDVRSIVDASGFAFQYAVEHLVHTSASGFKVIATEHAWAHPRSGTSGFADIILEDEKYGVRLVIECKRLKKDGQWVFLLVSDKARLPLNRFEPQIDRENSRSVLAHWTAVVNTNVTQGTDGFDCEPASVQAAFCVVRGTGEGQTPMLERLAAQLVEATEAIGLERLMLDQRVLAQGKQSTWLNIPVIVTNAELNACFFDAGDVNPQDGLLPKTFPFKDVSVVRFAKNLVTGTELTAHRSLTDTNRAKDRTVFVVNALAFPKFLKEFGPINMPEPMYKLLQGKR